MAVEMEMGNREWKVLVRGGQRILSVSSLLACWKRRERGVGEGSDRGGEEGGGANPPPLRRNSRYAIAAPPPPQPLPVRVLFLALRAVSADDDRIVSPF